MFNKLLHLTPYETSVVGSEFILSLYPILIKLVPTNLPTQVFSRLLTYVGASGTLASAEDVRATWGSVAAIQQSLGVGAITILHIIVSYVAFSSLSAGVSMSLFYTYPLWNLLGAWLLHGEPIHAGTLPYMGLGILGTFLLSSQGVEDEVGGILKNRLGSAIGVAAALGSALTETAMYFIVKERDAPTPWQPLLQLYGGALMWFLAGAAVFHKRLALQFRAGPWAWMVAFNLLVGFAGYALRFYAVPKVPTEIFGFLTFAGVLGSFLFGYFFAGERPSLWTVVGAGLIVAAMSHIETLKGVES